MAEFAKSGPYSEKTVKERRKMPIKNIVGMIFLVAFQVIAILLAAFYDPEPEPLDHIFQRLFSRRMPVLTLLRRTKKPLWVHPRATRVLIRPS